MIRLSRKSLKAVNASGYIISVERARAEGGDLGSASKGSDVSPR